MPVSPITRPGPGHPRPRRRGPRLGPFGAGLILLALWAQALAPAAALRMVLAAADPLAGAVICGHAGDSAAGPEAAAEHHAPAPRSCDRCGLCHAGHAPSPGLAAPAIARTVRWIVVAWPIPPPARSAPPPHRDGRPRGPPILA